MTQHIDYNEYFKNIMELLDIDEAKELALTEALEIDYNTAQMVAEHLEREELMSAKYKEDEIFVWPTEEARKMWHTSNGSRSDQHKK